MSETSNPRVLTYEEFANHVKKENLWLLIHNKVYDVSKFIDEHPGGEEVMCAEAGKDATEAFEDVGHSDEARALMPGLYIGDFEEGGPLKTKAALNSQHTYPAHPESKSSSGITYLLPFAALGLYVAWRFYSSA